MISDSTTNGTKPNIETCVLYARVSSHKQVEEGSGLSSQITRCKDFARSKGFATLDIFMDEGVSGGELERRGMDGLIAFLEDNASADAPIAVVVDDISRLARGVATHETIRNRIYKAHGVLFSPSQRFGRDADSRMVEMMQATVAEHFKNKNAETTRARLKARWMGGYYTASPPCGYKYDRVEGHGKMLLPDEPAASIIAEAFEGLASGRFQTATEVARWLETHPTFPRPKDGRVRLPFIIGMIRRSVYAGFLCVKSQGISMRPGKHEPLISVDTWERAKARLDGRSFVAPRQQEIAEDFSLRNYVNCASCGGVLTAGWSKGQTKRYAYYVCQHKGCDMRYKSIRRASLEGDFLALIKTLTPAPQLLDMARAILRDLWEARLADGQARKAQLNAELATITDHITGLTDRLIATNVPAVIRAYERQIETLEAKRATLSAQVSQTLEPRFSFDDISERVWQFLSNAWILWEKGTYAHKRLFPRLTLTDNLTYCRDNGFQDHLNGKFALPFKALTNLQNKKYAMVPRRGPKAPKATL